MAQVLMFPLRVIVGAVLVSLAVFLIAIICIASWLSEQSGEPFAYGRHSALKSKA